MINYKSYRANNILKSFEKGGPGSGPHKEWNESISEKDIHKLQRSLSDLKNKYRSLRRTSSGHHKQEITEQEKELWDQIKIKQKEIDKLRESYFKQNGKF